MEANEGTQDGSGDGSGDGAGTGTGTGQERERERGQGWRHVDKHRMGTETKTKAVAEMGTGTRMGTGTGTRTESGRAEERRRSARNRTRVVHAMWETGEPRVEREKDVRQERDASVAADSDNLDNRKEAGGEAQGTHGLGKDRTSRESAFPLSRLIRGFRNKYH